MASAPVYKFVDGARAFICLLHQ